MTVAWPPARQTDVVTVTSSTASSVTSGVGASTDNAVVRWDGTTGLVIQNSGVILDDSNNASGLTSIINPLYIGGQGTTSTITFKTTTNTGASGANMLFLVGTNGGTEAMRITNSGLVGIGQTSPTSPLHVVNTSVSAVTTQVTLQNADTNVNAGCRLLFNISTTPGTNQAAIVGTRQTGGAGTLGLFSSADGSALTEGLRLQTDARVTRLRGVIEPVRTVTAAGAVTMAASTDYIVVVNKTVGAATTVNLPASPSTGQYFIIKDGKGDAATNNITVTPAAGNIDGSSSYVMNVNFQSASFVYGGSVWSVV